MLEKVGFTQAYAFTVTLKPVLFRYNADEQVRKTASELETYINGMSSEFTLVAELTKNANVHYHGIIKFPINRITNINKYWKDKFRNHKLFGFVDIKVMDDEDGWIDYISKDFVETNNSLCFPIISDSLASFPLGVFPWYHEQTAVPEDL